MSDAAPDSTSSIYRTTTWILVAALIGLYSLYNWYQGTLKQGLVSQGTEIAQSVQRLSAADAALGAAAKTEQGLKAQIAQLQARAKGDAEAAAGKLDAARRELDALQGRYDAAGQEIAARKSDVERLDQALAEAASREQGLKGKIDSLGAERAAEKQGLESKLSAAAEAEAALRADYDAEKAQVGELKQRIARLEQSIAQEQTKHAAELQAREAKLNERIDYYRTALEGSEPDRAAQIAGLSRQAEDARSAQEQAAQALARAREAMKAEEAELTARIDEATGQAQAGAQALKAAEESHATEMSEARGKIFSLDEGLKSARSELAALQEKLNLAVADLNAKLEKNVAALAASRSETDAAKTAASEEKQALEVQIKEAQGRAAGLEETLAAERSQAQASLAELKAKVEQDEAALTSNRAELAAAAEQKGALEQQVQEARGRVVDLEQTLKAEQQRAEVARAADRRASEQALSYVRDLYTAFAALHGQQTDRGMLLSLADEDLHFASGYAVLPAGEYPSLDQIARLLNEHPKLSARIEGHTDSAGPEAINREVSQARADAVKQALVQRGVAPERLAAEGLGESRPIADNATGAGRRKNRRVEVYVIEQGD